MIRGGMRAASRLTGVAALSSVGSAAILPQAAFQAATPTQVVGAWLKPLTRGMSSAAEPAPVSVGAKGEITQVRFAIHRSIAVRGPKSPRELRGGGGRASFFCDTFRGMRRRVRWAIWARRAFVRLPFLRVAPSRHLPPPPRARSLFLARPHPYESMRADRLTTDLLSFFA